MILRQTFHQFDGTETAIVGMAGRFPGARDLAAFWKNLQQGVESIRFFSEAELKASGVEPARLLEANFVRACGDLEGFDLFDAGFFGFSPMDAAIMDPQQRVFLECAWEALEDAGYDPQNYAGAVGVFAGSGMNAYMMYNLISNRDLIDSMGRFAVWTMGNDKDFLTTRVSYLLNLKGPSVNVQTACSTSLVAIHLASQSLLCGECDMALAGGVTLLLPQDRGYLYREGEINSPDGHCRAFDANAKGTVFGSGAGIVVLKRLADALRDEDNIYAIIKGSAINNDGSSKVGYTAPSVEGQAKVIAEALEVANVDPETISYVEAHGTGTPIGDPIEVAALTQAFREKTSQRAFCAIGSLKTNIGHLDTAAGVAGIVKTALALKHKELPPTLHYETPNPEIDFSGSPFFVNTRLSEWQDSGLPRRAGISSLGVGGTNAHVILEEAPLREPSGKSRSWQLVLQSARSADALKRATSNLSMHLTTNASLDLADVAFTLQVGRRRFNHRSMLLSRNLNDAAIVLESLDASRVFTQTTSEDNQSVLFMFPGQGSQYVNMGRELYEAEPVFRQELDRCSELLRPQLGFDLRELLYPSQEQVKETASERLLQTAVAQPAIFAIEYALAKLWMAWGVHPAAMIGHSIGEYVAACIAGVFSLEDALSVVAERGRLMQEVSAGAMLAVPLPEGQLKCLLGEDLSLAAVNAQAQCVVSGSFEAITALQSHLIEQNIDCKLLRTSHAFHSKMMDPILRSFFEKVRQIELRPPQIPYISNLTGSWITSGQAKDPEYWVRHLRQTVRFADGLRRISEKKWVLLEVGPGKTLGTFAKQQKRDISYTASVSSLRHPNDLRSDTEFVLSALGRLWLEGVRIDWAGFYAGELRRRVSLPTYPFERQRYWINPGQQEHPVPPSSRSLKKQKDIADWFYLHTWKEAPLVAPSKLGNLKEESAQWLVFTNECEFSSRVVDRLKLERDSPQGKWRPTIAVMPGKQFEQVRPGLYRINPSRATDYGALFDELAQLNLLPTRIAHLWNVTAAPIEPGTKDLEEELALSFYSLLYLAQELGTRELNDPVQVGIVATGTSQLAGETLANPERATVLGACTVISHEFANLQCKSIDIVLPEFGSQQEERLITQLISEISTDFSNAVIAYRGYQRWVQTFAPIRLEEAFGGKSRLKHGGTYLITGGLGGIGLAIAEYLAKAFQAKLVLVGRSGLPPREHWTKWLESHDDRDTTSSKIRKVEELERLGAKVVIATADVTVAHQMRNVVAAAKERFGEIHGVIHAAGVIRDGLIQLKSSETAAEVLAPKVKGTLVLDAVLRGEKLDFFVLFSSVSAITGPVGTVDYSAANAFLNAFAQQKAVRDDTYTLAIDWGVWREVGMAAATVAQVGASDSMDSKLAGYKGPHPLLGWCLVDSADEKVYITELTDTHWVMNEHRFQTGEGVFPGAAYLEIARAVLDQTAHNKAIEITDLLFLEPLILNPGEQCDLRAVLKKNGDSFDFVMSSVIRPSGQTRIHARGSVSCVDSLPERAQLLSAIEAGCNVSERTADAVEQNRHIDYGPRWRSVKQARFGNREALLTLELSEAFGADLEEYKLHPALLDVATGGAHALISGHEKLKDFYVPLSYGKARINAPLPAKIFSHVRVREDTEPQKGVAVFDITLLDQDGVEIVQISNFVVRKIRNTAKMTSEAQAAGSSQLQASHDKGDPITQVLISAVEQGITPAEGVDAFCRALSSSSPRIVISSQDLNAVMEESDLAARALQSRWSGQTDASAVRHARPELSTRFVPAGTEQERKIAGIWQELLGIDQIGMHDDFFELGGHSLMIVRVHTRIQQTFDVTFPVAKMFQYPTINALANYLYQGQGNKPSYENLRERAERQRERQKQLVKRKSANEQ